MSCKGCRFNEREIAGLVWCDWLGSFTENKGCPKNPVSCDTCKHPHEKINEQYICCDDKPVDVTLLHSCEKYEG